MKISNAFAPIKCPICKKKNCTKLNYVHQSGYQTKYLWGWQAALKLRKHKVPALNACNCRQMLIIIQL